MQAAGASRSGTDFSTHPPKAHRRRINACHRFEQLILGQHKTVFAVTRQPCQTKRYIAANFAGLIQRRAADNNVVGAGSAGGEAGRAGAGGGGEGEERAGEAEESK